LSAYRNVETGGSTTLTIPLIMIANRATPKKYPIFLWIESRKEISENVEVTILEKAREEQWQLTPEIP
jgi:hypothetical protein